ncbi:MAG: Fe-S protein assembly co-chaperone HscB [Betaproteobacteria bacterium]
MIDFSADHFALLGLPRRFQIDRGGLDRAYRTLQAAIHPDRHAAAGDSTRRLALQASARVNEAYEALRDPASRGEYLLGLSGIASLAETDTAMPMDFLAEQMERREAIEDAMARHDHGALEHALDAIGEESRVLEAELGDAIDVRAALDDAKTLVRKLRFLDRVRHEITEALIAAEA